MASFTLLLTQAPLANGSHYAALDFARALLNEGHQLRNVFFYQEACYVALSGQTPIQGQTPLAHEWRTLAIQHNFPLQVCIANALRRGLVDSREQQRYQLEHITLDEGFSLTGLGEIASSIQESDRVLQF